MFMLVLVKRLSYFENNTSNYLSLSSLYLLTTIIIFFMIINVIFVVINAFIGTIIIKILDMLTFIIDIIAVTGNTVYYYCLQHNYHLYFSSSAYWKSCYYY